jgi:hypothetical protein
MRNLGKPMKQAKVSHLSPKGHVAVSRKAGQVKRGRRVHGSAAKLSGHTEPRPKAREVTEVGASPVPILSRHTKSENAHIGGDTVKQKYITIGYGRL